MVHYKDKYLKHEGCFYHRIKPGFSLRFKVAGTNVSIAGTKDGGKNPHVCTRCQVGEGVGERASLPFF